MTAVKEALGGAIDALKGSPLLLILLLFQFALLGAVSWNAHEVRDADKQRFELLLQTCGPK